MKIYLREREKQKRRASTIGVVLTLGIHILCAISISFTGIKYIYPPPAEKINIAIEFEEEKEELIKKTNKKLGLVPEKETNKKEEKTSLQQRANSPYKGNKPNKTTKSGQNNFGDVDINAPKEEKLDPKASFPGMSKQQNKVTSPHNAKDSKNEFKPGESDGNTASAKTDEMNNVKLEGRHIEGILPKPTYTIQKDGIVVVEIWVDQHGNVQTARPGVKGTTLINDILWEAAKEAALNAKFNISTDAPARQKGTITYIFRLE